MRWCLRGTAEWIHAVWSVMIQLVQLQLNQKFKLNESKSRNWESAILIYRSSISSRIINEFCTRRQRIRNIAGTTEFSSFISGVLLIRFAKIWKQINISVHLPSCSVIRVVQQSKGGVHRALRLEKGRHCSRIWRGVFFTGMALLISV